MSGEVRAGFGAGTMVMMRGYRSNTTSTLNETSDFALGPAFRVSYHPTGVIFVALEGIYGLRDVTANLTLNFQDVVLMSFGVQI